MIIVVLWLLIFLVEGFLGGLVLLLFRFSVFMCDLIFVLIVCRLLCVHAFYVSLMIIFFPQDTFLMLFLLFHEITWCFVILCVVMWLF